MDSKYYTPEIEEFYVGFEYEAFNSSEWFFSESSDGWKKMSWDGGMLASTNQPIQNIYGGIIKNWIRVKYLDKSDIESLGWKLTNTYPLLKSYDFSYGVYDIFFILDSENNITIYGDDYNAKQLFYGKIKNKSELKKIIQQLGI